MHMARTSTKMHNCSFCRGLFVPVHKMSYILFVCRCGDENCSRKFVRIVCQLDQTKSGWWASDLGHLHIPTTNTNRRRDNRMKQFILENMDTHRPYTIFLELRRMGYDASLKSVQMSIYRAKKGRWTNCIETCSQNVQARIYRNDLLDVEPFYFGPQAVPGCSLGSGAVNDPLILGIASRYTLSSLRFLEEEAVLCIDGTYGLNDRNFPVIVLI